MCMKISAQDFYQIYRNEKVAATVVAKIDPNLWWMV